MMPVVTANVWRIDSDNVQGKTDFASCHQLKTASTDGQLTVHHRPRAGKKVNQRKQARADRTTLRKKAKV